MYANDIEHIWQMSWRTSFYRGGPVFMSALAGIDIALWDLKGRYIHPFLYPIFLLYFIRISDNTAARELGVPIYQLLGGKLNDELKVVIRLDRRRPARRCRSPGVRNPLPSQRIKEKGENKKSNEK